MSIESVMPSNHLILCCPLLLLSSIFSSIRVFSNKLVLCIRWPKYWSFSFNISPSSEYLGLISFRISKGLSRVFSNTTVQKHKLFSIQLSYGPTLTFIHDQWKNHCSDYRDLCWQSDALLFNMLSRLVIAFLPRNKCLLVSWLQSPSAMILEPPKIKSATVSTVSPSICHEVMGPDAMVLVF